MGRQMATALAATGQGADEVWPWLVGPSGLSRTERVRLRLGIYALKASARIAANLDQLGGRRRGREGMTPPSPLRSGRWAPDETAALSPHSRPRDDRPRFAEPRGSVDNHPGGNRSKGDDGSPGSAGQ
jgi:hypothetical protein